MPMAAQLLVGQLVVAHDGGLLDERLDAAEARRDAGELGAIDDVARRLAAALDDEAHDAPAEAHLLRGDGVIGVGLEARVVDALDARMRLERAGDGERGRALPLHAEGERLHAAADEGRRVGIADRRRRRSRRSRTSEMRLVDPTTAPPRTSLWPPKYFVALCTERSTPKSSGPAVHRRGEGRVDERPHARRAARGGEALEVDAAEVGVASATR